MRFTALFGFVVFLAVSSGGVTGHAAAQVETETVASVNAEKISVRDLREILGLSGGVVPASWVPVEKKKEALDRMVVARLLGQSARAKNLDNTAEFRDAMARKEPGITVDALFRQEAASRVAVPKEEVRQEAARLRKKEKDLSGKEAQSRAGAVVWERNLRRFHEELVAQAKQEASVTVDGEAIGRIGKDDPPDDNTVLGTAGGEAIRYGDVKRTLAAMSAGRQGGGDLAANPVAVRNLVDRELAARALLLLAREQVPGDSRWMKTARAETERAILVNILVETVILKKVSVTDPEIRDAYARHSGMLVRDGKPIPLSEVKEQIRGIVLADKRKAAVDKYVAALRNKAKIRTYEKLLPKV